MLIDSITEWDEITEKFAQTQLEFVKFEDGKFHYHGEFVDDDGDFFEVDVLSYDEDGEYECLNLKAEETLENARAMEITINSWPENVIKTYRCC